MNRANALVFSAAAVTGANTYTSGVTQTKFLGRASYVVSWTGTPSGALSVEVSNDPDNVADASATWTALQLSGSGTPSGAAGATLIHLTTIAFGRMRLKYANTAGSGTLTAAFEGKAL